MDYNVQGNKVVIKASSTAFPGKEMEYSFTFGEPFDNMGMDGSPFKVIHGEATDRFLSILKKN